MNPIYINMNNKFDLIIDNLSNGNISDVRRAIRAMSKLELMKFIVYATNETYQDLDIYFVNRLIKIYE